MKTQRDWLNTLLGQALIQWLIFAVNIESLWMQFSVIIGLSITLGVVISVLGENRS